MLLTITTTERPATDLGYLLHKHPGRVQTFDQASGTAHVFYPQATDERCTAALLLEVDPLAVANSFRGGGFALAPYVNDRPYVASSLLTTAMKKAFATAMTGRCDARPELAARPIPLEVTVPAVRCREGAPLVRRLFEPLGWRVEVDSAPADPDRPEWGDSPVLGLRLIGTLRLADALNQLYVLLPVLDDAKHYWVGEAEVDKLLRAGGAWLAAHPERDAIARRYLARQRRLADDALDRLGAVDDRETDEDEAPGAVVPLQAPLAEARRTAVLDVLRASAPRSVGDLGCGEGALLPDLLRLPGRPRVVATDVSVRALRRAAARIRYDELSDEDRARVAVFQSSLVYRDARIRGLDAAVLMEVVEHVDPDRLGALEQAVFAAAAPRLVVVSTPNAEHNVRYPALAAGGFRHPDHRFEWTRAEFAEWADAVAGRHGYAVRLAGVGGDDPEVGPPTQLAVFERSAA